MYHVSARVVICLLSCLVARSSIAQGDAVRGKAGPFGAHRDVLQSVFKLRLRQERLEFDQEHWDKHRQELPLSDQLARWVKEMRDSGIPENVIQGRIDSETKKSGIETLIDELADAAKSMSRSSRARGHLRVLSRHGDEIGLAYVQRTASRYLRVAEEQFPDRVIEAEQRPDGQFRLILFADDSMVVLTQLKNGKFRLIETGQGPSVEATADSYGDLLAMPSAKDAIRKFADAGISMP